MNNCRFTTKFYDMTVTILKEIISIGSVKTTFSGKYLYPGKISRNVWDDSHVKNSIKLIET